MTQKRRGRPPTKKSKLEEANRLLEGLLRSPKTRNGLIAAVAPGLSKNYVYGWITEQIRTGRVTPLKASDPPMYQMTEYVVIERPLQSEFPMWLEPRVIPPCSDRQVHIDGRRVQRFEIKGEQQT
jgi:hypothetical protein